MGDERFGRDQSLHGVAGLFLLARREASAGGDRDGDGVGEGEKEARAIAGRTMRLDAADAADAMRKRPFAAPKLNQSLA